ncbi:cellobiose phosphorylase [Subdoligranulum sp. AF14-43]|nr:cellobiose phosphorylase [Subdoligranulum sp. AF14-43]
MMLHYEPDPLVFDCGDVRYEFTQGGDVRRFLAGEMMVNRLVGNELDGGAADIWLRLHDSDGMRAFSLLHSAQLLERSAHCLRFSGQVEQVEYVLTFHAHAQGWLWQAELKGSDQQVDLLYGQDAALAMEGAVLENDLYVCQYLGHTILKAEEGYVICSRQNLPQNGRFPSLQLGMLEGEAVGYSTDATQFFGLESKAGCQPRALAAGLENKNLQFECAYPALQSQRVSLCGRCSMVFYGLVTPDHPQRIRDALPAREVARILPLLRDETFTALEKPVRRDGFGSLYTSPVLAPEQLEQLYPERRLEEKQDGQLVSFFGPRHEHVVLQQKELLVQRPHANILTTFINTQRVDNELITTTCAMYGMFNGQTVIGNTNKHKLLSAPRGLLNHLWQSGMRIWAEINSEYRPLGLPAVFETGLNYCRWLYRLDQEDLWVETFAAAHSTDLVTQVRCSGSRRFIVTCQLVMGTHEYQQDLEMIRRQNSLVFRPALGTPAADTYPDLEYEMFFPAGSVCSDDRIFFGDDQSRNATLLTLQIPACTDFSVRIHGQLDVQQAKPCATEPDFEGEKQKYLRCYGALLRQFSLKEKENRRLQILNETLYWYAHNALVHYAAPHGLEQPGGAAWGTRDVCQGPFEFFMTFGQYPLVRDILLTVFRHQDQRSGEWPQWFMFDRYPDEMDGCHGDVVFWPLKCLADYLDATGDTEVLDQCIPFAHGQACLPLQQHVMRALDAIQARFLPGTALLSYAGGDWDDTLQPSSRELQECLVSSWTQALAFQVLDGLSRVLPQQAADRCGQMAQRIRSAFLEYLVVDGVIAGFVYRLPDGRFAPMLHPLDEDTGIHLRLLPMTRSIIAGISSSSLADSSLALIEQKLHCPDGVRLMDHPARYSGGECRLFRRAEQAANVGREISLQYTHAHIRYIEALCKMGLGDHAWQALFEVNPVCLAETVSNALPRQSNLYFSSSDGDFADRWIYDRECGKLLTGEVGVKGGWRLYSSGPGIYLHQLVAGLLGMRLRQGRLELDPVLPRQLLPLEFSLEVQGKPLHIVYREAEDHRSLRAVQNGRPLADTELPNPYRRGGISIALEELDLQLSLYLEIPFEAR